MSDATVRILVDADACPVKDEVYRVAERHQVPVTIVSNSGMRIPRDPLFDQEIVSDAPDAADDWIAEHATPSSIVITADILLAQRCVEVDATVLSPSGKSFDANSIGAAVATRNLMAELRSGLPGDQVGGPPPFTQQDRSRFLSALDAAVVRLCRAAAGDAS